ncbi:hypothetical protein FRC10_010612 [Ceratobasidium sp. 414]|nr:hypothetical protein FRC10_010612 [Ceratobasidium sp. 414]
MDYIPTRVHDCELKLPLNHNVSASIVWTRQNGQPMLMSSSYQSAQGEPPARLSPVKPDEDFGNPAECAPNRRDQVKRLTVGVSTHASPQPSPKLPDPSLPAASHSHQPLTPKEFSADSAQSPLSSLPPAPASPAPSKHSSLLHAGSRKRLSAPLIVSTPPATIGCRPSAIKIRDFAFPPGDEHHTGDEPLAKRASITPSNSNSSHDSRQSESPDDDRGSQGDPEDIHAGELDAFVPGTYRALYAFEPQGIAEMALAEGQHVYVLRRGGGDGWVEVLKHNGIEYGLVPEGYLELVRPDFDGEPLDPGEDPANFGENKPDARAVLGGMREGDVPAGAQETNDGNGGVPHTLLVRARARSRQRNELDPTHPSYERTSMPAAPEEEPEWAGAGPSATPEPGPPEILMRGIIKPAEVDVLFKM